jgi:acyl-CoA synthetase (AMP-forming)/AMP-acid ligase II
MQSYALTVDKFIEHAAKWAGRREVVTGDAGGPSTRIGYAGLRDRANRLSGALAGLGLGFGDRIATLAWNTQHHLEIYYAAMGCGLVCHTLNPRLTTAHLTAMIGQAQDRVLAVAADLAPRIAELAPFCPALEQIIVLDAEIAPSELAASGLRVWAYEALLEDHGAPSSWGAFDENAAAGLCYTSGTTGSPKGVLYTHRSNYLHTLRALQADAFALTAADVVLAAVPMFHANGWGLPFAAPAAGAKLVLPGRHLDGASLARLMAEEGATVAAGVPTVWLALLDHLDAVGARLPQLRRIIVGGSAPPATLIRRLEDGLGVRVQTSWGMTELSPLGTISSPGAAPSQSGGAGRPALGVDLLLTDADGVALEVQRGPTGRLKVRGASVVDRYFEADLDAVDENGWFDTGDLASLDETGELTIRGRSKDLIKSGGEWINPAEIEAIVGRHPAVGQVAVIGRADPKWGERPVLIVELRPGEPVGDENLVEMLRGKVAAWWIPDQIVQIAKMPLAATGKIDKARLRADYVSGDELERKSGS